MIDIQDFWIPETSNGSTPTHSQVKAGSSDDREFGPSVQGQSRRAPWEPATGNGAGINGGFEGILNVLLQNSESPIPDWSIYPATRDAYLRKLYKKEPIMAGAMYSMSARISSLAWKIIGAKPRVKKYYQELFGRADFGKGLESLIKKTTTSLNSQDNGAFWELRAPGDPLKPRKYAVRQINHLDSAQCWRTFDPEFPVLYINPYTYTYHRLHHTRVVCLSSDPQPVETARGIGYCAVSRVLLRLQIAQSLSIYMNEKLSGRFTRALGFGNGFTPKQFEQAVGEVTERADNLGLTRYMNIPFMLSNRDSVDLKLLNLAGVPEGFNSKEEFELYVNCVALGFGVDSREFWPATSVGATKADAEVQQLKARGKGIGDLIQTFEHAINWQVIGEDSGVEFEFDFIDDEEDRQVAELQSLRTDNIQKWVSMGAITVQQAYNMGVSQGLLDPKILNMAQSPDQADDTAPYDSEIVDSQAASPSEDTPPPDAVLNEKQKAEDTAKPEITTEITGEPLPTEQAVAVEEFDPDEIAELFMAFSKLPKVSKLVTQVS